MTTRFLSIFLAASVASIALPARATSWPVFGFSPSRSGFNTAEKTLTPTNVSHLKARWQISLGVTADSSPIVLSPV
ncbi:MAG: hypothetical protein JO199_07145, partial [Candidatus Eremiobacteraeota bacterium]|nr:hypothetical protein [Candidatus Eremiobacteraeota bacterium]